MVKVGEKAEKADAVRGKEQRKASGISYQSQNHRKHVCLPIPTSAEGLVAFSSVVQKQDHQRAHGLKAELSYEKTQ